MMMLEKSLADILGAGAMVARIVAPEQWLKELLRDIPEAVAVQDPKRMFSYVLGIAVVPNHWLKHHLVLLDVMGSIVGVIDIDEQEEGEGGGGA